MQPPAVTATPARALCLLLATLAAAAVAQECGTETALVLVTPTQHSVTQTFPVIIRELDTAGNAGILFTSDTTALEIMYAGTPCVPVNIGAGSDVFGFESGSTVVDDALIPPQFLCMVSDVPASKVGVPGKLTFHQNVTLEDGTACERKFTSEADVAVMPVPRNEMFFPSIPDVRDPVQWDGASFSGDVSLVEDLVDTSGIVADATTMVYNAESGASEPLSTTVSDTIAIYIPKEARQQRFGWTQEFATVDKTPLAVEKQAEFIGPDAISVHMYARVLVHKDDPTRPVLCFKSIDQVCTTGTRVETAEGDRASVDEFVTALAVNYTLNDENSVEVILSRVASSDYGDDTGVFGDANLTSASLVEALKLDAAKNETEEKFVPGNFSSFGEFIADRQGKLAKPVLWTDLRITIGQPLESATQIDIGVDQNFAITPAFSCASETDDTFVTLVFTHDGGSEFPADFRNVVDIKVGDLSCKPVEADGSATDTASYYHDDRKEIRCSVQAETAQSEREIIMENELGVKTVVGTYVFHDDSEWQVREPGDDDAGKLLGWTGVSQTRLCGPALEETIGVCDTTLSYEGQKAATEGDMNWQVGSNGLPYLFLSSDVVRAEYRIDTELAAYEPTANFTVSAKALLGRDDVEGVQLCVLWNAEVGLGSGDDKVQTELECSAELPDRTGDDLNANQVIDLTVSSARPFEDEEDDIFSSVTIFVRRPAFPVDESVSYADLKPVALFDFHVKVECGGDYNATAETLEPSTDPPPTTMHAQWGCLVEAFQPDDVAPMAHFDLILTPTDATAEPFRLTGVSQVIQVHVEYNDTGVSFSSECVLHSEDGAVGGIVRNDATELDEIWCAFDVLASDLTPSDTVTALGAVTEVPMMQNFRARLTSLFNVDVYSELLEFEDPVNLGDVLMDPALDWTVYRFNGAFVGIEAQIELDEDATVSVYQPASSGDAEDRYLWFEPDIARAEIDLMQLDEFKSDDRYRAIYASANVLVSATTAYYARISLVVNRNATESDSTSETAQADEDPSGGTAPRESTLVVSEGLVANVTATRDVTTLHLVLERLSTRSSLSTEPVGMAFGDLKVWKNCLLDRESKIEIPLDLSLPVIKDARPRNLCRAQQTRLDLFDSALFNDTDVPALKVNFSNVGGERYSTFVLRDGDTTLGECSSLDAPDGDSVECTVTAGAASGNVSLWGVTALGQEVLASSLGSAALKVLEPRQNLLGAVLGAANANEVWEAGGGTRVSGTGGALDAGGAVPFFALADSGHAEVAANVSAAAIDGGVTMLLLTEHRLSFRLVRARDDAGDLTVTIEGDTDAADYAGGGDPAAVTDASAIATAAVTVAGGKFVAQATFSGADGPAGADGDVAYAVLRMDVPSGDMARDVAVTRVTVARPAPATGPLLVTGVHLAVACHEEAEDADALVERPALPVIASVSTRLACPNNSTTVTLEGEAAWGASDATRPLSVRAGERECAIDSVDGRNLTCTFDAVDGGADVALAELVVTSELDSNAHHGAANAQYVSFAGGESNLVAHGGGGPAWTALDGQGNEVAVLTGAAGDDPADSYVMAGRVAELRTELELEHLPNEVLVYVHAERGDSDESDAEVCLRIVPESLAVPVESGDLEQCQRLSDRLAEAGGGADAGAGRPVFQLRFRLPDRMPTLTWRAEVSLRRLGGFATSDGDAAGAAIMRWSEARVAFEGACPAFSISHARVTPSYDVHLMDVKPSQVRCLELNATHIRIKMFTPYQGEEGSLFALEGVDWDTVSRLANGSLQASDDGVPAAYAQEGVRYPWVPSVEVGYAEDGLERPVCRLAGLYAREEDLPADLRGQGANILCDLPVPETNLRGSLGVWVLGQFVANASATFEYELCIVDEPRAAVFARDAALYTTGTALFVALVVGASSLVAAALSKHSAPAAAATAGAGAAAGAAAGRGDLFRMVFFIQYVAALQFSSADLPKTNLEFGNSYSWLNGMILPPWAECVDPNAGKGEFEPRVPNNLPCKVPDDQLFLGTLYWQCVLALIILVSVQVFIVALRYLWHRVRSVRLRIDVDTINNFHLTPVMVGVRLALLAVTGISLVSLYEMSHMAGVPPVTAAAYVVFLVFCVGFPAMNLVVVSRMAPGASHMADSTRAKAEYAFGGLFAEYEPGRRVGSVMYLAKRIFIGGVIGALKASAEAQLALVLAAGLAYLAWLARTRPFLLPGENRLQILLETAEVSQSLLMLLFVVSGQWQLLTAAFCVIAFVGLLFIWLTVSNLQSARRAWSRLRKKMTAAPKATDAEEFELSTRDTHKAIRGAAAPTFGSLSTLQLKEKAEEDRALEEGRSRSGRHKKSKKSRKSKKSKKSKKKKRSRSRGAAHRSSSRDDFGDDDGYGSDGSDSPPLPATNEKDFPGAASERTASDERSTSDDEGAGAGAGRPAASSGAEPVA